MIKNPKIGDIAYAIDKWRDLKAVYAISIDDIITDFTEDKNIIRKIIDYNYEVEYNIKDCYDNLEEAIEELLKYQLEIIYV